MKFDTLHYILFIFLFLHLLHLNINKSSALYNVRDVRKIATTYNGLIYYYCYPYDDVTKTDDLILQFVTLRIRCDIGQFY